MSITDVAPAPAAGVDTRAETVAPATPASLVPCPKCQQPVPGSARKCTKCHEWIRGWRRVIPLSETALSLLLGLISVASIVAPKVIEWIWPDSKTSIAIASGDRESIQVAVSNTGRWPSVVRSYSVSFDNPLFPPSTVMGLRKGESVFGAGKDGIVALNAPQLSIPETNKDAIAQWLESGEVTLTAWVRESNDIEPGEETPRADKIAARRLRDWIDARIVWTE